MNNSNAAAIKNVTPDLLTAALEQVLSNGKEKKDSDFMADYPTLQQYIHRGVSQRVALDIFNKHHGHSIQLPRFRQMLKAEKARRERDGDIVVCPTCGQIPLDTDSTEGDGA